jgi:uncharacterized membrane protein
MTIGRILFALPFLVMGVNHFIMTDVFVKLLVDSSFIPGGGYTVLLTGAFMIVASIALIFNKWIPVICYLLAAMLFIFIVTIHIPGFFAPDVSQGQIVEVHLMNMLKDVGLMGGALLIAGYHQYCKENNPQTP